MQNLQKARRIGGKGTPRIPPKKIVDSATDILNQTILAHKKSTVKVESSAAFIVGDENISFSKPDITAIRGNKQEPIAYIIRGKSQIDSKAVEEKKIEDVPEDFEKAVEEMENEEFVEKIKEIVEEKKDDQEKEDQEDQEKEDENKEDVSDKNTDTDLDID
ncbi:hypothetical protein GVAV_002165 [Gurleya vavrai]